MYAPWTIGGVLLGFVFFGAVLLVQPVGVSTQFVVLDAILWGAFDPGVIAPDPASPSGYTSLNAYLSQDGGRFAAAAAEPLGYGLVFVAALMVGARLSATIRGGVAPHERAMPAVWRERFGGGPARRWITALVAGAVVLYGARLAGGCASGHMISGPMQTALSGFVFTAAAIAAAIPVAIAVYGWGR